jgi:glycosyltransferase involved in cell wall biosynthesis
MESESQAPPTTPYHRLGVIIPAYNAGGIITDIILSLKKYLPSRNILVVDDGSRDHTLERVRDLDVLTFAHQNNRGKGAALETGFNYLSQLNLDYYATIDADGQHNPDQLPLFMEAISRADLVIGNRMENPGEMPLSRRFSNRLSSLVVSLVTRRRIPDSQCGYRLIRADVMKRLHLSSTRYDYETELLLKAARAGLRLAFVPIESRYFSERSQFRKFSDTLRFIRLIFRSLFWRKRKLLHD